MLRFVNFVVSDYFLRKCKCVSANELYRPLLLTPNAACRYVYCIVYTAVFGAVAVTMHFRWGDNPPHPNDPSPQPKLISIGAAVL